MVLLKRLFLFFYTLNMMFEVSTKFFKGLRKAIRSCIYFSKLECMKQKKYETNLSVTHLCCEIQHLENKHTYMSVYQPK